MGYQVLSYEAAEGVVHMSTVLHPVEHDNATATGFVDSAGTMSCISSATLPLHGLPPCYSPVLHEYTMSRAGSTFQVLKHLWSLRHSAF